jgi:hypothetical protein
MRAPANVIQLRPRVGSSCPDPTCGAPLTRETRDGVKVVVGPVRSERDPLSFRLRLAIGFTLICAIVLVMLSGSYGEKVGAGVDESGEEVQSP